MLRPILRSSPLFLSGQTRLDALAEDEDQSEVPGAPARSEGLNIGRGSRERHGHNRTDSRGTSRASSPDAPLARRYGSVGSHMSHGSVPKGSLSSALTGSYIANLRTKDYTTGAFRRV